MAITFVIGVAILLGLTLLLYQEVRRPPGPMEWGRTPRWKKRVRVTLAIIPLLLAFVAFWAFFIEPNRLVIRQETIAIDNWPKELDQLKIAVISDIHTGGWCIDDKKVRLIVERTNQLQPELIVILGDYISVEGWTSHRPNQKCSVSS